MKKQVLELLDELDTIKHKAQYEIKLRNACDVWLKNYMRRKYD